MKKLLALLLISILAIGLLAACSGAPAAAPSADGDAGSDAEMSDSVADDNEAAAPVAEEPAAESSAGDSMASMAPAIEPMTVIECNESYEGETVYFHQHAGREGPLAAILGDSFALATESAVNEINASGGICGATIEVIFRETQYNVEQELVAYEEARAFDPKPAFILTYGSGATIALKDRVFEDQIINFVAGLNAEAIYNPPNGYTVTNFPIYSDQFAGFVKWLSENWADIKPEGAADEITVGVIGWANAFGAGATTPEAIAIAEDLGITVLPLEEQAISPEADVTGQIQNLLLGGANAIYSQNLSFGTAQVIGTIHALGAWDQVVVGGVNWSTNTDVIALLGENAALAEGYYGIFPHHVWNDVDQPGVQQALAAFEAAGHAESEKTNTYLTAYAQIHDAANTYRQAANMVGLANVDGAALIAAMEEMGQISAGGILTYNIQDGNRAGNTAHIRRAAMVDGAIQYEAVSDFFVLPDAKPTGE